MTTDNPDRITVHIDRRLGAQLARVICDERDRWPPDTAYQDALADLVRQMDPERAMLIEIAEQRGYEDYGSGGTQPWWYDFDERAAWTRGWDEAAFRVTAPPLSDTMEKEDRG